MQGSKCVGTQLWGGVKVCRNAAVGGYAGVKVRRGIANQGHRAKYFTRA